MVQKLISMVEEVLSNSIYFDYGISDKERVELMDDAEKIIKKLEKSPEKVLVNRGEEDDT